MAKGSGVALALYLAALKPGARARAERRLQRETQSGAAEIDRAGERLGASEVPRPDGPFVWVHVGSEAEALGVPELIDRLREERDDIGVLITTARHGPDQLLSLRLPRDVLVQYAPFGLGPGPDGFLAHWRPDALVWADNEIDPMLIDAAHRAGVPMFLVDARMPDHPRWRWLPGMRRALLNQFSAILAGDITAADRFRTLGVPADRIEAKGFLQEGTAPLPCSQAERDSLAELLAARPVWLAVSVTAHEIDMVVEAHRQAIRRSHRLLLILVPHPLDDGPGLARRLEEEGWVIGLRSVDDEPEPEMEIFVADLGDELGLWHRLSPISLMGGTVMGDASAAARNPYEAAALGSAVLYGPHMGIWRESYTRLREAGAARAVADVASLARAVEFLLAPDKVAEMAAAAWEVTTSGAEATDRVVALVLDALDARGV